jgi:hypothetical protein
MNALQAYSVARERFRKVAMLSSGLALLMAGASRVPILEVSSPVGWLVGSVNVGFLPIFGPILVVGAFCALYTSLRELVDLRTVALEETKNNRSDFAKLLLRPPGGGALQKDRRDAAATLVMRVWNYWIPVLAYAILVGTYFDFVRPTSDQIASPMYDTRTGQVVDLIVGRGGWSGFRPILPSIQSNLAARQAAAEKREEVERLRQLAQAIPWIYPPFQTWVYVAGFVFLIYMVAGAWKIA